MCVTSWKGVHINLFEPFKFDQQSQLSEYCCVIIFLPTVVHLKEKSVGPFIWRDGCFEGKEMFVKNGANKICTMRPMIH